MRIWDISSFNLPCHKRVEIDTIILLTSKQKINLFNLCEIKVSELLKKTVTRANAVTLVKWPQAKGTKNLDKLSTFDLKSHFTTIYSFYKSKTKTKSNHLQV